MAVGVESPDGFERAQVDELMAAPPEQSAIAPQPLEMKTQRVHGQLAIARVAGQIRQANEHAEEILLAGEIVNDPSTRCAIGFAKDLFDRLARVHVDAIGEQGSPLPAPPVSTLFTDVFGEGSDRVQRIDWGL
jgi:hypothetical protein